MGWVVGIILGLMLLAAMGGTTDPSTVAPAATTVANPGGGHCGYGPADDDVPVDRILKAVPGPNATNHC